MSDKTEQPTPRRLRHAREQGDLAVSSALTQAVAFLAAMSLVPALIAAGFGLAARAIQDAIEGRALEPFELSLAVLGLTVPLLAAAAFTTLCAGLVQSGGAFVPSRFSLRLDRLNPLTGITGLFSAERAVGVLRALLAAGVVDRPHALDSSLARTRAGRDARPARTCVGPGRSGGAAHRARRRPGRPGARRARSITGAPRLLEALDDDARRGAA